MTNVLCFGVFETNVTGIFRDDRPSNFHATNARLGATMIAIACGHK